MKSWLTRAFALIATLAHSVSVVAAPASALPRLVDRSDDNGLTGEVVDLNEEVVIDPRGGLAILDDGSVIALMDNSRSTTEVGYEVVLDGRVVHTEQVAAGERSHALFYDPPLGDKVILGAYDTEIDRLVVPGEDG